MSLDHLRMQLTPTQPSLHCDTLAGEVRVRPVGAWTLNHYETLCAVVEGVKSKLSSTHEGQSFPCQHLDLTGLTDLDTAGADQLAILLGPQLSTYLNAPECPLPAAQRALLLTVATARAQISPENHSETPAAWREMLERIGASSLEIFRQTVALLQFMGITLEALVRNAFTPRRWRVTSLVAHIEDVALNAVPIIALLNFMVGAVIAFLGATILAGFGAGIYTVNLVTFSFLREFAVLLTAILVAGRTASAFTAQIGAMKANEEIDAIRMLGLNPIDLLVLPRVLALTLAVPCLTLIGMASGILGGALVCMLSLDITPSMFLSIFQERTPLRHFLIGMAKAPIFAFAIGIIGCLEGFKVSGSARSLGQRTTSAVVQSIFIVILFDALAALFFMEMKW